MSAGLEVMQGFPCQCDLTSSTEGPATEGEVRGREGEGGREEGKEERKEGGKGWEGGRGKEEREGLSERRRERGWEEGREVVRE